MAQDTFRWIGVRPLPIPDAQGGAAARQRPIPLPEYGCVYECNPACPSKPAQPDVRRDDRVVVE